MTKARDIADIASNLSANAGKAILVKDDGSELIFGNASSAEVYGLVKNGNNLNVITTNQGADNISNTTYNTFDETIFAASGFTLSINASGNLIATV